MQVGFIGLGVMGRPMVERLIKSGHKLSVNRVKDASRHLVDLGAESCDTPKAVALAADVIILIVPDTPDVESVLFGPQGVADGLASGKLVIDMSSISPVATKQFAEKVAGFGCDYLDAPVSGGEIGARNGTLSIMVGGRPATFERARPLFEVLGKNITRVGGVGDGQTAKVANQIMVALNIAAVAEALTFAKRAGADPKAVRQALMGGFASSRVLEVHGERMIERSFDPGFRIRLHRKDLSIAVSTARDLDLALPNTASTQQLMNSAIANGDGDKDHSALIQTLERLSGTDV